MIIAIIDKININLELLVQKFGNQFLHKHIMEFIKESSSNLNTDIAIHKTVSIDEMDPKYVDKEQIARPRGFLGGRDFLKFPAAKHHFVLVKNKKISAIITKKSSK